METDGRRSAHCASARGRRGTQLPRTPVSNPLSLSQPCLRAIRTAPLARSGDVLSSALRMDAHGGTSPGRYGTLPLTLTALGVVYGDIGTSPLYAIRECF